MISDDKLFTLKDIYFAFETNDFPSPITPFCLFITLRAESNEVNSAQKLIVKIITPDNKKFVDLYYSPQFQINNELTILYLKGNMSFIQPGKHIVEIIFGDYSIYSNPIFTVIQIPKVSVSTTGSTYSSSSASSSSSSAS